MSDPWIERELLRRQRLHRKMVKGMTLRERIEEELDQFWCTVPEAAEELGEHPKTVYERIRRGEIKATRQSPRKTRIHYTALAAYMSKRTGDQQKPQK
jgi:excisionase family DNA binding protein